MKIPFAGLFRKSKARLEPKPRVEAPLPTAKKAESERLAKTVMPSYSRVPTAEPEDDDEVSSPAAVDARAMPASAIPTETARAPVSVAAAEPADGTARAGLASAGRTTETAALHETAAPRPAKVSMGGVPKAPDLPLAVAFALEPNVERAISLQLQDVIAQMPEGYLKPRESFDLNRTVLLKAAEVERGMAMGRPAIAVTTLFAQAPDIFMHAVPASDEATVALPFDRVMHALSNLVVRSDQAAEQAVPEVETPFLQVTREDTERLGSPMPMQPKRTPSKPERQTGAEESGVRIEMASAEAFAAAVPEPADTFVPPIATETADSGEATSIPFIPEAESDDAGSASAEPTAAEQGGNKKFGTGEPAFPRVPASSGPPVPLPAAEPTVPALIPFKFPAPSDEARKSEAGSPIPADKTGNVRLQVDEAILTLPLRPILQSLPPMQLGGNPATVAAEATVSFPMSMIAPQLASGKVVVTPNAFYAVLPEEYRKLFLPGAVEAPVQLSLAGVLANLPEATLRLRDDQEVHEPEETFETPFSAKAAEDAARFEKGEGPAFAKATARQGGRKAEVEVSKGDEDCRATAPVGQSKTGQAERPPYNSAALAEEKRFDAKDAVAKASALSGVESCSVIFADGLGIAGNIPESANVEGVSAVAPTLLQKLAKHMLATSLGSPQAITVYGEKAPVSFFTAGNICLTAMHRGDELGADTRRELVRMTEEISRAYSGRTAG